MPFGFVDLWPEYVSWGILSERNTFAPSTGCWNGQLSHLLGAAYPHSAQPDKAKQGLHLLSYSFGAQFAVHPRNILSTPRGWLERAYAALNASAPLPWRLADGTRLKGWQHKEHCCEQPPAQGGCLPWILERLWSVLLTSGGAAGEADALALGFRANRRSLIARWLPLPNTTSDERAGSGRAALTTLLAAANDSTVHATLDAIVQHERLHTTVGAARSERQVALPRRSCYPRIEESARSRHKAALARVQACAALVANATWLRAGIPRFELSQHGVGRAGLTHLSELGGLQDAVLRLHNLCSRYCLLWDWMGRVGADISHSRLSYK